MGGRRWGGGVWVLLRAGAWMFNGEVGGRGGGRLAMEDGGPCVFCASGVLLAWTFNEQMRERGAAMEDAGPCVCVCGCVWFFLSPRRGGAWMFKENSFVCCVHGATQWGGATRCATHIWPGGGGGGLLRCVVLVHVLRLTKYETSIGYVGEWRRVKAQARGLDVQCTLL